jgi:hypothetical protein
MLKNGLNEHFLKKLLKRKVHLVVRKENETEGSVTATANDNLKTITHTKRQDNPRYILQRNKEDPPVTKNSGGNLVTDLVRQFEGWAQVHPMKGYTGLETILSRSLLIRDRGGTLLSSPPL